MKKSIPSITIEQLNACDKNIKMKVDIRRLEVHKNTLTKADFPHRHDFYNLIYIKKGSGTHHIDFKRFEVEPNQMFFMNDGQVHEWDLSEDTTGYTLFFKKEFYEVMEKSFALQALPFFNNGNNDAPVVVFSAEQGKTIENLFEEIIIEFNANKPHRDIQIKSFMKIILINALRIYQPLFKGDSSDLNISKIRNFEVLIEKHFKEYKSVKDFADKLNITANYLNAICTKTVGKTAGEMIRDRVILEAKRLLLHSSISVCEMAYLLGYDDCSYFIRVFKKEVEHTPEHFRLINK
jgi:AraC family transcriptional regulator, transcriptional activator of pobA